MANNVASERVRMGYTQKELADELEVSESSVYRWEAEGVFPSGTVLIKMHRLFGCSTDYLLGVSDERKTVA